MEAGDPLTPPEQQPMLDPEHRNLLLSAAEEAVRTALLHGKGKLPDPEAAPPRLRREGASFVTLRRDGALLGCIGSIEPRRPLVVDVAANALAAAFADPRLPPVTVADYREMEIKVSVLSPLEPVEVADRETLARVVQPGVDGLLISAGVARGTFLPSVWEQLPDVEDFLDQLWMKAGLPPRVWPEGITVHRYRTHEFGSAPPREL